MLAIMMASIIIIIYYYSLRGRMVIACSYDGSHFGGCVDDVDGVVILRILLSGQRKMKRMTAFPLKKEFEKNYPLI